MSAASEVIAEGKDEESVVTMSMKSLTAAGKFKKRRYKEENQKKSVTEQINSSTVFHILVGCSQLLPDLV